MTVTKLLIDVANRQAGLQSNYDKSFAKMKVNKAPLQSLVSKESGFTLIEVMVALAILAVVAVAASRASSAYINSVDVLKTRTLAHFVAQNAAAELRIQQRVILADSTQAIESQGREWQIVMSVSNTMTPTLKQVNISVAPIIDTQVRNAVTDIDILVADAEPTQESNNLDLAGFNDNSAPLR